MFKKRQKQIPIKSMTESSQFPVTWLTLGSVFFQWVVFYEYSCILLTEKLVDCVFLFKIQKSTIENDFLKLEYQIG